MGYQVNLNQPEPPKKPVVKLEGVSCLLTCITYLFLIPSFHSSCFGFCSLFVLFLFCANLIFIYLNLTPIRVSVAGPFAEGSPLNKTISLFAVSRALFNLLVFVTDEKVPWQGEQFAETMYLLFNVCDSIHASFGSGSVLFICVLISDSELTI
jgi:hypothetical protein